EALAGRRARRRRVGRDEAGLAVLRIETALGEEATVWLACLWRLAGRQRPLHGIECSKCVVADVGEGAEIEGAAAAVLERGERGVLAENVGGGPIGKRRGISHATRDLRHHPPVGLDLARQWQERALARDPPLGIGNGAILLAPGRGRKQNVRASRDGVV